MLYISLFFINRFYFFTCILPNYLAYERLKEFLKNSHLENMTAVETDKFVFYAVAFDPIKI